MSGRAAALTYALITPARNEREHLTGLIASVESQTVRPVRWVIVSDGSTDGTDDVAREAVDAFPWIQLLRLDRSSGRDFAGKAEAVNAAYRSLSAVGFDCVGNLDADITVPRDYYEFLLGRFERDPKLGVAGTPFLEDASKPHLHSYAHRYADLTHVSGACQVFRRRCFDEIGGYLSLREGGIDWAAVTAARMKGWTTRTFLERACVHHRAMGTADRNVLRARLRHGREEYLVGGHPIWQIVRALYQMKNRPVVLGGLCLLLGYFGAWISRRPTSVPETMREFHRSEQLERLRQLVFGTARDAQVGT